MIGRVAYAFGEDAERERRRLAAVGAALDGPTMDVLRSVGLEPGWRCWEAGAGHGSIARALVAAGAEVLATDVDDRWFGGDVAFLRHDVVADPLPGRGGFDLVHARLLLEHLAAPRAVVARMADALAPAGVLVVENAAGLDFAASPPCPALERLAGPWELAGRAVGWDAGYGRVAADDLRAAGLAGVAERSHRVIAPGGNAWLHVRDGIERLRGELDAAGAGGLDAALACLADPGVTITGAPIVAAWGRRPL
jgi:SAM-dependent methyltransferase